MQNDATKKKRIRFAALEILLLIALYCALAFIGSLADSGQISHYPDRILAQNIAVFAWVMIAAPLAIFELRRQQREDPTPSLSRKEARENRQARDSDGGGVLCCLRPCACASKAWAILRQR